MSGPGSDNEVATSSSEMQFPRQMDNVDWGKKKKLVNRKVSLTSSGADQKNYGSKAIMTKENKSTFKEYLLTEKEDVSLLPDAVIGEIKKKIREGAKDLVQMWKDALELVHTAYHVSNIRRPTPDEKGAWKQYEELIRFGVRQLAATRGIDGPWRTSAVLVREDFADFDTAQKRLEKQQTAKPTLAGLADKSQENHIGTRRFFVEIPGQSAAEIDAKTMDEIIEMLTNKLRRNGAKLRVEERTKTYTIVSVWVQDVKRDRIVIKEVS